MTEQAHTGAGEVLVDRVSEWLMSEALGSGEIDAVFQGCCQRLAAAGVPLSRAFLTFRTLHPLYATITMYWHRGRDVEVRKTLHGDAFTSEEYHVSPIYHMLRTQIPYLRRRLVGEAAQLDFPVLEELRAEQATDYLAYMVAFAAEDDPGPHEDGIIGSWATDRAHGFTDADLRALQRVQTRLAVACKVQIQRGIARNVVDTYLGGEAGAQVLTGQIRRGDVERIYAVIWYSDLRGSTGLAERLAPEDFLALVNEYFECTAGAVLAHGGQVLRFIGDAVLAIFPLSESGDGAGECAACPAVDAARDAERRLEMLNRTRMDEGEESVDFGLALHVGEVLYGNIGVPERLEFTVTGPAANEVARLEGLTKLLGRRVLVSGELTRLVEQDWEPLGRHALRGVGEPVEVFALPS